MAKSSRKPSKQEQPEDATRSFEDTVVGIASGVTKAVNEYKIPIIAGIVVLIGMIGLFGLYRTVKEKQQRGWNAEVHEFFLGTSDEIRAGYPELIEKFEGTKFEPFVITSVTNWLHSQDTPEDRAEATRITRDALTRLEDERLLAMNLTNLEGADEKDRDFTIPEPRPEPATVPENPEGTPTPKTLDDIVPKAPEGGTPKPDGDTETGTGETAGDGATTGDGATGDGDAKTEDPPKEETPPTKPGEGDGGDGNQSGG